MKKTDYFAIDFVDGQLEFLDQTKLPLAEEYCKTDNYEIIAQAIEVLKLRGAPQIGVASAYALALSIKNSALEDIDSTFNTAYNRLASTRPTAVNLFFALNRIKNVYKENSFRNDVYSLLIEEAKKIHSEDIEKCKAIGKNGLRIFKKKANILTHCNTGKLATSGDGTAFNIIKTAFEEGLVNHVYADETRPLLQGSRLTAFELEKCNIPFSIQTDSMAAVLMKEGKVDLVITGADRIALNGDSANKIGTYALAVLCNFHNIPFYIAAPTTTFDKNILTGAEIEIEFRNKKEVIEINNTEVTKNSYDVYSPAFDVTPSFLITGIITENDFYTFPYNFLYD
ncbi:MAG: S-methyl-5-thioribose-1-phosphate isomerase [Bacteroidota bacterium]|nr:S-methyl-5-thioribose-1-phosphate isomerase [Bacteroidota bacterium]